MIQLMFLALSLVEFTQYFFYVEESFHIKKFANNLKEFESIRSRLIKLPQNVPISGIIEATEGRKSQGYGAMELVKLKGWKLYDKYIRYGSEYELNVSDKKRRELDKLTIKLRDLAGNILPDHYGSDYILVFNLKQINNSGTLYGI